MTYKYLSGRVIEIVPVDVKTLNIVEQGCRFGDGEMEYGTEAIYTFTLFPPDFTFDVHYTATFQTAKQRVLSKEIISGETFDCPLKANEAMLTACAIEHSKGVY